MMVDVGISPIKSNIFLIVWMTTDLPIIALIMLMYYKSFSDHFLRNGVSYSEVYADRDYRPLRELKPQ